MIITKENEYKDYDRFSEYTKKNNTIKPEYYSKFNVKRGLRNDDGSGVVVGLTEIGDVHGYIVDENEIVPVEGRLKYRGYPVSSLVSGFQQDKRSGFEETAFLLLFGKLPDSDELNHFIKQLNQFRVLPNGFTEDMIFKAPSNNVMNKLARSVLALYSYDLDAENTNIRNILKQCISLISRFPVLVAYAYRAKAHYYDRKSLFIHAPDSKLNTAENFLRLIRASKEYTALEAEVLDLCLVLHAEHGGGNNSTFSIHVVSSSDTDTYSTIAAAIGSLKGSKHGGANVKVISMIEDIKENVKDYSNRKELTAYLKRMLNSEVFDKSGLIYGLGHAVYTISDPRAVLLKEKAEALAAEKGLQEEFQLYLDIEEIGPGLFQEVKNSDKIISANVDLFSGFVYGLLNIPPDLFAPLFAVARIAGWSAHRIEEIISGKRIIRPAYKNVIKYREYINMSER